MNELTEKIIPAIDNKKRGKLHILRTFEVFNKENLNLFKNNLIKIILIETENIFANNKKKFNIDFKKDNSVQVSVFNDIETYSLFSNTIKRYNTKNGNINDKNNKSGIFDQLPKP